MSLPVYVDAYSGYKANEQPRQFELDEQVYEIAAVENQWYSPNAIFFKVRTGDGKRYIQRYDESADAWSLQSAFDGDELLARPGIELVTLDAETIRKAEAEVEACEHCHPDAAEIPFDWLLAETSTEHGSYDFILTEPARCPNCRKPITEKTLVELHD